jgi:hypothetical protein
VSRWRRKTVGDLTSTLFRKHADTAVPKLPVPSVLLPSSGDCEADDQYLETGGASPSLPTKQRMPKQGGGSQPASRYFKTTAAERAISDDHRTPIVADGPAPVTKKSAYNRLAVRA